MSDVTRILAGIESGDLAAAEQLLPLVYDELRKLAAARLAHEQPGQTLQATALVHEAYLRLVGPVGDRKQGTGNSESQHNLSPVPCSLSPASYNSRGHFFAAAAEAMRRILVERARSRKRLKRGGDLPRLDLVEVPAAEDRTDEMLAVHEALERLDGHDPQLAQLVKLRYFAGLRHQEAAEAMGIGRRAADRLWALAKAWLCRELRSSEK